MIYRFEIDTQIVKSLDITLSQYLFINLISSKSTKTSLREFVKLKFISDDEFIDLIKKQIITEDSELNEPENVKLNSDFTNKLKEFSNDDFFEAFADVYPTLTYRPTGLKDYLKTSPKRAKALYKQAVGNNRERHRELMAAIQFEVADREVTGQMPFMKKMVNWLTSEGWSYAEERMANNEKQILPGYGESFI